MYKGFNLALDDFSWIPFQCSATGRLLHSDNKQKIIKILEKFQNADTALDAKKIVENWFPQIGCQVFLSHSHKDQSSVIKFAGWLKEKFDIDSFIDSTVWGYSGELLKLIDEKYCVGRGLAKYDYDCRNRSTSYVHMLLSTALMSMIDSCECIIFFNTPHSYTVKDCVESSGITNSPWIYNELVVTRLIRKKSLGAHRPKSEIAMEEFRKGIRRENANLLMDFPVELNHLTDITQSDIYSWALQSKQLKKYSALDYLYKMSNSKNAK